MFRLKKVYYNFSLHTKVEQYMVYCLAKHDNAESSFIAVIFSNVSYLFTWISLITNGFTLTFCGYT